MSKSSLREAILRGLVRSFAATFRHLRSLRLRRIIIDRVWRRYLSWRAVEIDVVTAHGFSLNLKLPDTIDETILLTQEWEPCLTRLVIQSLRPGDTFVDVGANIGYYTILSSMIVGIGGAVYSIEASPSIYNRLKTNLALNKCPNVRAINAAASCDTGEIQIWSAKNNNLGHSTIVKELAAREGHVFEAVVSCMPLTEMIPLEQLKAARLIKIDVEGAERSVLQGIVGVLKDFSPETLWLIEFAKDFSPGGSTDLDWIFELFVSHGYHAYQITNSYDLVGAQGRAKESAKRILQPPDDSLSDILFARAGTFDRITSKC